MNDPTPTDDELISSYIDGEATFDEVARIEADPALLARVREFRAAKDLLSTPVQPLPESDVDRLIDNALTQSSTSDRITDLAAARSIRSFNPQRFAAVAATLVLLAGAVGAVIAFSSDSGDEMFASTNADDSAEMADDFFGDDGDDMADDGDAMGFGDEEYDDPMDAPGQDSDLEEMADWALRAESAAAEEADSYAEDELAESDDMADTADSPDSEQSVSDETGETGDDSAARTMSYRPLELEIAERYETLDELISHTTEQWSEMVAAGATVIPQVAEEQGIAEQALADVPCGQILRDHIDTLDHSLGSGGISVGETIIADSPATVVVVELSIDTAEVFTTTDPDCEIVQLATLNP